MITYNQENIPGRVKYSMYVTRYEDDKNKYNPFV